MNTSLNTREMDMGDIARIAEILAQNFSKPWSETDIFTYFMRNDAKFFVTEKEGQVVGCCGVLLSLDEGDILNVAVEDSMHGQGVGTQMVHDMIEKMAKEGVTTLHLEVRAGNEAARKLYTHAGFEEVYVRKDYYTDPTEDGITMSRRHSH